MIVKLFFHLSRAAQAERLDALRADPWRRWRLGPGDIRSLTHRADFEAAFTEAFAQTDTRWAPWQIIDAGDERAGCLAALDAIATAFAKAMPAAPPAEGETLVYLDKQKRA